MRERCARGGATGVIRAIVPDAITLGTGWWRVAWGASVPAEDAARPAFSGGSSATATPMKAARSAMTQM